MSILGLVWSVTLTPPGGNGRGESSNSGGNTINTIIFTGISSGTYGFTVTPPAGYYASPETDQVNVNGSTCTANYIGGIPAACVETITFTPTPTGSIGNTSLDKNGSLMVPMNTNWVGLISSNTSSMNEPVLAFSPWPLYAY
jgi:hypothetical protein